MARVHITRSPPVGYRRPDARKRLLYTYPLYMPAISWPCPSTTGTASVVAIAFTLHHHRYRQHHPPHSHARNNHRDIASDQVTSIVLIVLVCALASPPPSSSFPSRTCAHGCVDATGACLRPFLSVLFGLSRVLLLLLPPSFSCTSIPSIFSPFR